VAEADRDALDLLRKGRPEGFDALYAQYHRRIYAFLFRLTGRRDTADDLFQETWLALARKGPALRPESQVENWLFTVARNAFLSAERKQRPAAPQRVAAAGAAAAEQASTAPAAPEITLSDIECALLALSSDDRQLLLLVGVEGLGQDDIAKILDIAPATLRQRVGRARARLAERLDEDQAPRRMRQAKP
jgi:RNA polymerase sigma-70 factor (ECF subfamily)